MSTSYLTENSFIESRGKKMLFFIILAADFIELTFFYEKMVISKYTRKWATRRHLSNLSF